MSRGTVGIVLCSLVLCSLVLADGASSESMGMEALGVGDRNLFTSTIGWTGHKLSHKQREARKPTNTSSNTVPCMRFCMR